jgi:DNA-binding NarL/FixJ family response regulator
MDAEPVSRRGQIRVLLADDHAFLRRNLRAVLEAEGDLNVVGEASDIAMVAQQTRKVRPHVLVLDIGMSRGSSLDAIRRLRHEAPRTAIVVTTMSDDPNLAAETLDAGAGGYVRKANAVAELPAAIRDAAAGEQFSVSRGDAPPNAAFAAQRGALSELELAVVRQLARGRTNTEIGAALQMSLRGVETLRAHIHRKLGISTRAEFERYAVRRASSIASAPPPR